MTTKPDSTKKVVSSRRELLRFIFTRLAIPTINEREFGLSLGAEFVAMQLSVLL
jgi:hypothetical protein